MSAMNALRCMRTRLWYIVSHSIPRLNSSLRQAYTPHSSLHPAARLYLMHISLHWRFKILSLYSSSARCIIASVLCCMQNTRRRRNDAYMHISRQDNQYSGPSSSLISRAPLLQWSFHSTVSNVTLQLHPIPAMLCIYKR